jgi:glycosyltransferase involved in cell wall biosynthesis
MNPSQAQWNQPRVAVAQIGARHHYAIPRMLEKSGHLQAFYTDVNAVQGLGRWLGYLPFVGKGGSFQKLAQRKPTGVSRSRIRHTDALFRRHILSTLRLLAPTGGYVEDDYLFDRIVASWGYDGANTLYAMQKHGTQLLETARDAGIRTVVDVFITPLSHRIVEQERVLFPEIEKPGLDASRMDLEDERTRREINHADMLLCPGMNVVQGLASFPNAMGKPYAVVPYGCGASFNGARNEPVKGRVLFAGTADLRKGIHYLGQAAEKLGNKNYDFRVAGNVTQEVRNHPMMNKLNFLGRVPRDEMKREFLQADVFVLPTLAEGCASVVHEAVMAGCPVVTTKAAGTLVENERGGLIIPERDPDALADTIARVVNDRSYRDDLARSCDSLMEELTEDSWSRRLLAALSNPDPERIKPIV